MKSNKSQLIGSPKKEQSKESKIDDYHKNKTRQQQHIPEQNQKPIRTLSDLFQAMIKELKHFTSHQLLEFLKKNQISLQTLREFIHLSPEVCFLNIAQEADFVEEIEKKCAETKKILQPTSIIEMAQKQFPNHYFTYKWAEYIQLKLDLKWKMIQAIIENGGKLIGKQKRFYTITTEEHNKVRKCYYLIQEVLDLEKLQLKPQTAPIIKKSSRIRVNINKQTQQISEENEVGRVNKFCTSVLEHTRVNNIKQQLIREQNSAILVTEQQQQQQSIQDQILNKEGKQSQHPQISSLSEYFFPSNNKKGSNNLQENQDYKEKQKEFSFINYDEVLPSTFDNAIHSIHMKVHQNMFQIMNDVLNSLQKLKVQI